MSRESEDTQMKDPDSDIQALRAQLVEAIERCTDAPLLDLVYKILVCRI